MHMCVYIQAGLSLSLSIFFSFFPPILLYRNLKIDSTFQIDAIICIRCNVIWHRRFMATLVLIWRLAESDITVMP
jgi:hypothetical protein